MFENRNFLLQSNHIGILVAELPAQIGELPFQSSQFRAGPILVTFASRCWSGGDRELLFDPVATLDGPNLVLAIQPEAIIESIKCRQIDLDLFRQFATVLLFELTRPLLL